MDYEIFELEELKLQKGGTLQNAKLAYKVYGRLNAARDNLILYPTWYSGDHTGNEWLIGAGKALDPEKYCILAPNMFGNGVSTSPSNMAEPSNGPRFPLVTVYDNVMAQHRLITEIFGVETLPLVVGWSMGAMQAFHWAALFPDMVQRIAPFCGTSKCSRHNHVFLEGAKAALTAAVDFQDGWYTEPPAKGLRAMARVYAGWCLSQTFYRQELDKSALGFQTIEDFLVGFWEGLFLPADANNLLAMINTWQAGDISDNPLYHGDFSKALAAIKAEALVMPCRTDLYFPPEDNEIEVAGMPNATLKVIESVWGHFAGGPGLSPADGETIDAALKQFLSNS